MVPIAIIKLNMLRVANADCISSPSGALAVKVAGGRAWRASCICLRVGQATKT